MFTKGSSDPSNKSKFSPITRKTFLKTLGFGAATFVSGHWLYRALQQKGPTTIKGSILNANPEVGHILRSPPATIPTTEEKVDTIIIGAGVAGLSAGWWFQKNGLKDFRILEMNQFSGGNSASGENTINKFPWGAHYVPIPGPDAHYVREFFEECGIITGYDKQRPIYNEFYLCADPQERLYFQGQWHENLIPQRGISEVERTQYDQFFSLIDSLKNKRGSDNKPLFTVPIALSSQDKEWLKLDKISMQDFMKERGWNSKHLNWYVDYCCRDDFGMPHHKVSAWAGLHYFAARAGVAANADAQSIVTWPEGNGFLIQKFMDKVGTYVTGNSLVYAINPLDKETTIDVMNNSTRSTIRYKAKHVVYAGPRFTATRVIKNYSHSHRQEYAPWLVANISVKDIPEGKGQALSWDNVSFYSRSLGYISANHQSLKLNRKENVLTYYLPLDELTPQEERKRAILKTHSDWSQLIRDDLELMHPGISPNILNMDVWIWGHGMVSPGIDSLWNPDRIRNQYSFGTIEFAHSDMSGISIFEEAQYQGVEAAKRVLAKRSL